MKAYSSSTARHASHEAAKGNGPIARFRAWRRGLSKPKRILAYLIEWLLILAVVGTLLIYIFCLRDLPRTDNANDFNTANATEVYASDGTTLLARFQLQCREPLDSLDQISSYVTKGIVATEDERFYYHNGIDLISIGRALINNLSGGEIEGASTLTQQLVRNTVLADEMNDINIRRKIREAYLALKMETMYSKDEILLLYLNTVNFGQGAYGIESAAKRYFNKSASELTLNEAATLVGIPQSPVYNNPVDYMDHAIARRNVVLSRMLSNGVITQAEYDETIAQDITLDVTDLSYDGIYQQPYFASYVREELTSAYTLTTEDVFQGGFKVITTLDMDMQAAADESVSSRISQSGSIDMAMTAIDPNTGYIKAMVGGKDYEADQWNLASQAQRQPGSSFKVFTLLAALEAGIDPDTVVDCGSWLRIGTEDHLFHNYGNGDYGDLTIADALAESSNTGWVRVCDTVGADKVAEIAQRLGVESELTVNNTLTLGSSGVTTIEMARAYSCIANGGTLYPTVSILTVEDKYGNIVVDNTNPEGEKVLDEAVCNAAIECMRGVINYGTATAAKLSGRDAAGKTGTSENYMDLWFVGFTPQLCAAYWAGDRYYKLSVSGQMTVPWKAFMEAALADAEVLEFPTNGAGYPSYTKSFDTTDLGANVTESSTKLAKQLAEAQSSIPNVVGMSKAVAIETMQTFVTGFNSGKLSQILCEVTTEDVATTAVADGKVINQSISGIEIKVPTDDDTTAAVMKITLQIAKNTGTTTKTTTKAT